jgi:hypothetical protein
MKLVDNTYAEAESNAGKIVPMAVFGSMLLCQVIFFGSRGRGTLYGITIDFLINKTFDFSAFRTFLLGA